MHDSHHDQWRIIHWYLAALVVFCTGVILAARLYPGGYDWQYTVVSSLASHKRNPEGGAWFAGSLVLSMLLLWPCVNHIRQGLYANVPGKAGYRMIALWTGILFTALVGAERLLIRDISSIIYKAHEIMALIAFLALYIGILGIMLKAAKRHLIHPVFVLLIAIPMLAIIISQTWIYPMQRELGWGKPHWRELGISYLVSFPFWQWLAMGFLWTGLGLLVAATARIERTGRY